MAKKEKYAFIPIFLLQDCYICAHLKEKVEFGELCSYCAVKISKLRRRGQYCFFKAAKHKTSKYSRTSKTPKNLLQKKVENERLRAEYREEKNWLPF